MNGRRAAARRSSAWGTTQSALTGRCGPCCSVDPTAITTGASAAAAAAISGHVIHSYSTVPAPTTGLIRSSLTATSTFLSAKSILYRFAIFGVASIDTTSRQSTHIRYVIDTGIYCAGNNRHILSQLSAEPHRFFWRRQRAHVLLLRHPRQRAVLEEVPRHPEALRVRHDRDRRRHHREVHRPGDRVQARQVQGSLRRH